MRMPSATKVPLVNQLIELASKNDRGALAALRTATSVPHACGGEPTTSNASLIR